MVRIGVIGIGGMGKTHCAKYAQMEDVEVVAYDIDSAKAQAVEGDNCRAVGSEQDLFAQVDALDICLPTDLHLGYAEKAFANGLHVLVEKPMARTLEECAKIIEGAQRAGVKVMPAQTVRFFPDYRTAHQKVLDGAVGTPAAARLRRGGLAPGGSEGWFQDFDRSGGVLLDLAVHDFDWVLWTLGAVRRVYSRSVRFGSGLWAKSGPAQGDYALTTLSTESGAVVHVESTWMDPGGFRTTLELSGSGGMLEYDSRRAPALRSITREGQRLDSRPAAFDDPYYLQCRAFAEAVAHGAPLPVTAEEGMAAVAISLAALESATHGRTTVPASP